MSTPSSPTGRGRDAAEYEKTIQELRKHNKDLNKELKQFNAALEEIKAQHEKALAEARSEARGNRTRTRTDGSLEGTPSSVNESEAVKVLEKEVKSFEAKIKILTKANKELKKTQNETSLDKVRALRNDIVNLNEEIRTHKLEISTLKNSIKVMRTAAFSLETEEQIAAKGQLRKDLEVARAKVTEYKSKLEDSERRQRKQQEAFVEAQQKINTLETKDTVKGRTEKEVRLSNKVKALNAQLAQIEQQRETERETNSRAVNNFQRRIQILEFTVKGYKQQMEEANLTIKEPELPKRKNRVPGMTRAQKLRQQKNTNPVLLEKLPGR